MAPSSHQQTPLLARHMVRRSLVPALALLCAWGTPDSASAGGFDIPITYSARYAGMGGKSLRRPPGEIALFARRMRGERTGDGQLKRLGRCDFNMIAEIGEHCDAVEQVVGIGAAPDHMQGQVHLCGSATREVLLQKLKWSPECEGACRDR